VVKPRKRGTGSKSGGYASALAGAAGSSAAPTWHAVPRTEVGRWPSADAVVKADVLDHRHVIDPSRMYHDRAIRDPLNREWLCRSWSRVL
jgi:hypothetical protein